MTDRLSQTACWSGDVMKKEVTCLLLIVLASAPVSAGVTELAKSSGIKGGLVVHLGCGDGRETAKLLLDDGYLVHGLDTDDGKVREAQENIRALKLYGRVSVRKYDGVHLPYTDSLVNLLIDSSGHGQVTNEEIMSRIIKLKMTEGVDVRDEIIRLQQIIDQRITNY